jgi:hypothetical protein
MRQTRTMPCYQPRIGSTTAWLQPPAGKEQGRLYITELMLLAEEARPEVRVGESRNGRRHLGAREWCRR